MYNIVTFNQLYFAALLLESICSPDYNEQEEYKPWNHATPVYYNEVIVVLYL